MLCLSFHCCNFPKEILSISKQHATAKNSKMGGLTNMVKITASTLTNIGTPQPTKVDIIRKDLAMEELLNDGRVYLHHFFFKSYELGPDSKATMLSITNKLQESTINHLKCCGLVRSGFGTTIEMDKRSLIWVVHKLQLVVAHYPSGNDIVQLRTWTRAHGKNSHHRDWIFYDYKTGEVLIRATCSFALMNKETRTLSKFSNEIIAEVNPYFSDCDPIINEDNLIASRKLNIDSDDYIHTDVLTRLSDLDLNQHINNAVFVSFILESAPKWLLESHYASAITLKYLKECGRDEKLKSLCVASKDNINGDRGIIYLHHSLRLQNLEITRGTTIWSPKL